MVTGMENNEPLKLREHTFQQVQAAINLFRLWSSFWPCGVMLREVYFIYLFLNGSPTWLTCPPLCIELIAKFSIAWWIKSPSLYASHKRNNSLFKWRIFYSADLFQTQVCTCSLACPGSPGRWRCFHWWPLQTRAWCRSRTVLSGGTSVLKYQLDTNCKCFKNFSMGT